jgi:hypothetical protein
MRCFLKQWSLSVFVLSLVSCRATNGDVDARCAPYVVGSVDDSISRNAQGLLVSADLDCDGKRESIEIRNFADAGRVFPRIAVESATLAGTLAMETDQPPTNAVLGDLDGDGVRDAVFTLVNESTVFSRVVLFTSDGPRRPQPDDSLDWRRFQYIRDENTPEACLAMALPTIEPVEGGNAIRLPYGEYGDERESQCGEMHVAFLEVTNGVLTLRRD